MWWITGGESRGDCEMEREAVLTRSFKGLVQKRVEQDPLFAAAVLREGVDTLLAGDVGTGKAILRDYFEATFGFETLDEAMGLSAKNA